MTTFLNAALPDATTLASASADSEFIRSGDTEPPSPLHAKLRHRCERTKRQRVRRPGGLSQGKAPAQLPRRARRLRDISPAIFGALFAARSGAW